MQKSDYEHVSCHCRTCFEIGHLTTNYRKGLWQVKNHQQKLIWWVGAKEEHQLITKEDPPEMDPPMDESKVDT
jgi:hypothetical protein